MTLEGNSTFCYNPPVSLVMYMALEKSKKSVGVHDGTFHADEVTACALLITFGLVDKNKVTRTRDPEKLALCEYVCDVGGVYDPQRKLFDHHQSEYQGELSSAGMVLNDLKQTQIISSEEFEFFQSSLVKGVDDHDNGRAPQEYGYCSFSHVIANFNPVNYEVEAQEQDIAFGHALTFVLGHLERMKERYAMNVLCRKIVGETMAKYRICLLFDRSIPWLESFFALGGKTHTALFVIMPGVGGHWKLRAIPPDYEHRMHLRLPLPEAWAGLLEDELKKASGIKGAVFCHKGRFTSVWETKEDALKALRMILEKNGIENEDHL